MANTTLNSPITPELLNRLFTDTAESLDVPASLYEKAVVKYEEVGIWLSEDEAIGSHQPEVYVQGSFRLGTAIKPIDPDCDYDIDLVCCLEIAKENITQQQLKDMIGKRLRESEEYKPLLSESRRCWNLSFRKQFHMDVLPSISNPVQPPDGILLTDTDLRRWQFSNPKEYAKWFHSRFELQLQKYLREFAEAQALNIEDVPEWKVKTPLQRAVQLLKRHRDIAFLGKAELSPVSIILTTLAAHAYAGEENVLDALLGLVQRMPNFIVNRDDKWVVENPVEPGENFADKWNEYPERRSAFLTWLEQVHADVNSAAKQKRLEDTGTLLERRFGMAAKEATARAVGLSETRKAAIDIPVSANSAIVTASHYLPPEWPLRISYKAKLKASVYYTRSGKRISELSQRKVPKKAWLRFEVETNAPSDARIRWQVVNTGPQAQAARQLRGDFYDSDSYWGKIRWESTQYEGTHWVEAFVIHNGVCIARSGRKYVIVA